MIMFLQISTSVKIEYFVNCVPSWNGLNLNKYFSLTFWHVMSRSLFITFIETAVDYLLQSTVVDMLKHVMTAERKILFAMGVDMLKHVIVYFKLVISFETSSVALLF